MQLLAKHDCAFQLITAYMGRLTKYVLLWGRCNKKDLTGAQACECFSQYCEYFTEKVDRAFLSAPHKFVPRPIVHYE